MKRSYTTGTKINFEAVIKDMQKIPSSAIKNADAWINREGTKIVTLKKVDTSSFHPTYTWLESDVSDKSKSINNAGYKIVAISGKQFLLHRLVALAWLKNDDPAHKTEVDHLDKDRLHCHADNLAWVTKSENMCRAHDGAQDETHTYLGRYRMSTQTFSHPDGTREKMTLGRYIITKRPDLKARLWKKLSYTDFVDAVFDVYYAHTDEDSDEAIFELLREVDFKDLYHECDKDLAKHYGFKCWLEDMESYM